MKFIGSIRRIQNHDIGSPLAIKPIPLQEYLGELNIVYKGDTPTINHEYNPGSFKEEFGRVGSKNK